MPSPIRVLLTDDNEIILDSLSLLLSRIDSVEVIGTLPLAITLNGSLQAGAKSPVSINGFMATAKADVAVFRSRRV